MQDSFFGIYKRFRVSRDSNELLFIAKVQTNDELQQNASDQIEDLTALVEECGAEQKNFQAEIYDKIDTIGQLIELKLGSTNARESQASMLPELALSKKQSTMNNRNMQSKMGKSIQKNAAKKMLVQVDEEFDDFDRSGARRNQDLQAAFKKKKNGVQRR